MWPTFASVEGFRKYLVGTMLGLPLPIMLYCLFFDYLAKTLHIA